ncbi:MAG: DsbA family protein [Gemmatimonadaceae bacterium]|nr:DsbA family protein [Gemmatimonadaceae bacterium]
MSRRISLLASLVASAAAFGAMAYRQSRLAALEGPQNVTDEQAGRLAAAGDLLWGQSGNGVILMFTDFQCHYCRIMHARLDSLRLAVQNAPQVVYRHFPLKSNSRALKLAIGAVCAARQGVMRVYADQVYANQDSLGRIPLADFGKQAGVGDTRAFARCLSDSSVRERIRHDVRDAARLRITGTPMLIIDGRVFRGAVRLDTLRAC